jgi:hypothetical protein
MSKLGKKTGEIFTLNETSVGKRLNLFIDSVLKTGRIPF